MPFISLLHQLPERSKSGVNPGRGCWGAPLTMPPHPSLLSRSLTCCTLSPRLFLHPNDNSYYELARICNNFKIYIFEISAKFLTFLHQHFFRAPPSPVEIVCSRGCPLIFLYIQESWPWSHCLLMSGSSLSRMTTAIRSWGKCFVRFMLWWES